MRATRPAQQRKANLPAVPGVLWGVKVGKAADIEGY
ncbi:hypothetical protein SAMN05216330_112108 [Bradyrhizobium sp. Ghvi]|nr:hypothetical protein SAMN05216330_112108 [Bradyrhizobium sp. Ghvi]